MYGQVEAGVRGTGSMSKTGVLRTERMASRVIIENHLGNSFLKYLLVQKKQWQKPWDTRDHMTIQG